jgi:hypothetical protein
MNQTPQQWFARLYEKRLEKFIQHGYVKPGSNRYAAAEVHPFNFSREIQQETFLDCIEQNNIVTQRDVLDCFFISFFAAWSDYRPSGKEKYVSAFCPRVLMYASSAARFLRDYPDGWILCSIRDPRSWYVSSSRHNSQLYRNVEIAIEQWCVSTQSILTHFANHPGQIQVMTYESLLSNTEAVMRGIAARLGIDFQESLLMPTYLSKPILPNSSFDTSQYGINKNAFERVNMLNQNDLQYIEKHAMHLYEEGTALAETCMK